MTTSITDTFAQGPTSPLEEAEKLLSDIQSLKNNNSGATDLANSSGSSDLAANNSDFGLGANNSDFGLLNSDSVWKIQEEKILADIITI